MRVRVRRRGRTCAPFPSSVQGDEGGTQQVHRMHNLAHASPARLCIGMGGEVGGGEVVSRMISRSRSARVRLLLGHVGPSSPNSQTPSSVKAGRAAEETAFANRRRVVLLVKTRKTTRGHFTGISHPPNALAEVIWGAWKAE